MKASIPSSTELSASCRRKKGYRFSVDAVILSRFVTISKKTKGSSTLEPGVESFLFAVTKPPRPNPSWRRDPERPGRDSTQKTSWRNRVSDRVTILCKDLRHIGQVYPPGAFHVVVSNPPYRKWRTGRVNPSPEKAMARHEIMGTLQELISVAAYLSPGEGRLYLIYPASRAVDLLGAERAVSGAETYPVRPPARRRRGKIYSCRIRQGHGHRGKGDGPSNHQRTSLTPPYSDPSCPPKIF